MNSDSRLDALEARLGYAFGDRGLLRRALVHRSLVNESELDATDSNERLEFLGDAALGLAAADYLLKHNPDRPEGELSPARAALVSLRSLARRAETIELAEFVSTGRGVNLAGGRSRKTVIGRAYEAIIGAVFVDGGMSEIERFLLPWFEDFFQRYDFTTKPHTDNKSRLQQLTFEDGGQHPLYHLIDYSGPHEDKTYRVEVSVNGVVLSQGEGSSVQRAELDAAGRALEVLRCDRSVQTNQAAN